MFVKLSDAVIEEAFRKHAQVYASGRRGWDISYHVKCWKMASRAFTNNRSKAFEEEVYKELRDHWQVFRGSQGKPWDASKVWEELKGLPSEYGLKRLSGLQNQDIKACWNILHRFAGIKPSKKGPSVVAISKFLHFWNPGLFVIVDRAVIWKWILGHRWLWESIEIERARLAKILAVQCGRRGEACDLLSYVAILFWGAAIIRTNPSICSSFAAHIRRHTEQKIDVLYLETYEAAALEWFLLGLVEIPPPGVDLF